MDFIPPFLAIIEPTCHIKSASLQLLTPAERDRLGGLVGLMVAYGLEYKAQVCLGPPALHLILFHVAPIWHGSSPQASCIGTGSNTAVPTSRPTPL